MRWSHKKKTYLFSNKEIASDITMTSNPSYTTNKQTEKQEYQYDCVTCSEDFRSLSQEDTIKLDANPSYGKVEENETLFYDYANAPLPRCDIVMQLNPSYSKSSEPARNLPEDQDGYVKTNQCYSRDIEGTDYLELIDQEEKLLYGSTDGNNKVKINSNESVSGGIKLEDDPSYSKIKFT